MLTLVSEAPISTASRIREAEKQTGLNAEREKVEGGGGVNGGSKEEQNTKPRGRKCEKEMRKRGCLCL